MVPTVEPPFAEKVAFAVNRASVAHPVKSIVTLAFAVVLAPMVPALTGSALVTSGVHAVPDVCVSVKLLIKVFNAVAVPSFEIVIVQTRAFCRPVLFVIDPFKIATGVTVTLNVFVTVAAAK